MPFAEAANHYRAMKRGVDMDMISGDALRPGCLRPESWTGWLQQ